MSEFVVYDKHGSPRVTANNLEYSDTYKGSCQVTISFKSPIPIGFEVGDYVIFREERFTLGYVPPRKKQATAESYGEAFVYESVIFNSYSDELTRCMFLDIVLEDNKEHYTSLPNVNFYASSIKDVADRIQANLDRFYGKNVWRIQVASGTESKDSAFSFQSAKCWDVLVESCNKLELNFTRNGRIITIGSQGSVFERTLSYGFDNGLKSISVSTNESEAVITRLRAYGSTRNMPYRYYNHLWKKGGVIKYDKTDALGSQGWERVISEAMYVPNLMLPSFRQGDMDAHLDSANQATYGVTEGSVFFDSEDESSETAEVYPTIEGMTASELSELGISVSLDSGDNGNLDEVASATQMTDLGLLPEDGSTLDPSTFRIAIKDVGFDINDYLSGEQVQITMRSGACIGRTFDVNSVEKTGNKYILSCERYKDTDVEVAYPNKNFQVGKGDKFSILGIYMPDVYVQVAENRLRKAAETYLQDHDHASMTYKPEIDDVFMARNPDLAKTLRSGDLLNFMDGDLGLDVHSTVSNLVIKYGDSMIPSYDVTLSDETEAELVNRVANEVVKIINTSGGNGISTEKVVSLIRQQGKNLFLSKVEKDEASEEITFAKGAKFGGKQYNARISERGDANFESVGTDNINIGDFTSMLSGGYLGMVGSKSYLEVDDLYVRMKAYFDALEINRTTYNAGRRIAGAAGIVVTKVEEFSDRWRCYYKAEEDGVMAQDGFDDGDLCFCEEFDVKRGSMSKVGNRRYWCAFLGKAAEPDADGYSWIELSKLDREGAKNDKVEPLIWDESKLEWNAISNYQWNHDYTEEWYSADGDAPIAGDNIVQLGNKTDVARQGAIIEQAIGNASPSYQLLKGIKTYSLVGTEMFVLGYDATTGRAKLQMYGDCYIGNKENSTYIKYDSALEELSMVLKNFSILGTNGEPIALMSEDKVNKQLIDLAPLTLTNGYTPTLSEIKGIKQYAITNTSISDVGLAFSATDANKQYNVVSKVMKLTSADIVSALGKNPTKGYLSFSAILKITESHPYQLGGSIATDSLNVSAYTTKPSIVSGINPDSSLDLLPEASYTAKVSSLGSNDYEIELNGLTLTDNLYIVIRAKVNIIARAEYINEAASVLVTFSASGVGDDGYSSTSQSYLGYETKEKLESQTIVASNGILSVGKDTIFNADTLRGEVYAVVGNYGLLINDKGISKTNNGGIGWNLIQ